MKRIAVVILNWNTRDYLREFLPPLLRSIKGHDAEVIVADNASTDGSVEMLEREFPEVFTIALNKNYGFTGGYNRAFSRIMECKDAPEYLVLLNTDVLVGEHWLEPLYDFMDSHEDCAVCGPKILALEKSGASWKRSRQFEYAGAAGGYLDRFGFPFCRGRVMSSTEEDIGQYDPDPCRVFWISGACMMTRSSVWTKLGGLDESFFAHMEEIDYCWRAALDGHSVFAVPQSSVWHIGGGTLSRESALKLKLNYRNSLLMLEKNLEASIGRKKGESLLKRRISIDNLTKLIFILTGRKDSAEAVRAAHLEYSEMHRNIRKSAPGTSPEGWFRTSIILQYALRGKRIFKYIRKHENRH
ncbi:MAG TPA: glycosyl transferase family 2 [Rikenellaceae bacterium]|nr:glycosyl transferase family 2 [Rikenellaceae bacterium]